MLLCLGSSKTFGSVCEELADLWALKLYCNWILKSAPKKSVLSPFLSNSLNIWLVEWDKKFSLVITQFFLNLSLVSLFVGLPVRQNSEHWRSHKEGMDSNIPSHFPHIGKRKNIEVFKLGSCFHVLTIQIIWQLLC